MAFLTFLISNIVSMRCQPLASRPRQRLEDCEKKSTYFASTINQRNDEDDFIDVESFAPAALSLKNLTPLAGGQSCSVLVEQKEPQT